MKKKVWLIHFSCSQRHFPGTFWDHCHLTPRATRVTLALRNFESYYVVLVVLTEEGKTCNLKSKNFLHPVIFLCAFFLQQQESLLIIHEIFLYHCQITVPLKDLLGSVIIFATVAMTDNTGLND